MIWEAMDFQRIVALDSNIVERYKKYLEEREKLLVGSLRALLTAKIGEEPTPYNAIPLSEAREGLIILLRDKRKIDKTSTFLPLIEAHFKEHLKIIEGSIQELFLQVDAIPIERRGTATLSAVETLSSLLEKHLEALSLLLWRFDQQLQELPKGKERALGLRLQRKQQLDRSIIHTVQRTLRYLKAHHKAAIRHLEAYKVVREKARQACQSLMEQQLLRTRDEEVRESLYSLHLQLKMWEINRDSQIVPKQQLVRAIRHTFPPSHIEGVFRDYLNGLKQAVVEWGRVFKREGSGFFAHLLGRTQIRELLANYRRELHGLEAMVSSYRDFLYLSHPDFLVRLCWSLKIRHRAKRPVRVSAINQLMHELQLCKGLYRQMDDSLAKESPTPRGAAIEHIGGDIILLLKELGQPLASQSTQQACIEKLLTAIQRMDELGSFDQAVVEYIDQLFNTMLRLDWKYHLLPQHPLFHELYGIHQQFVAASLERAHLARMRHFTQIMQEIEGWVKIRDVARHIQEIESHVSELKGYLQNFLAHVQQQVRHAHEENEGVESVIKAISRQLLDYRYLFAHFFARLQCSKDSDTFLHHQFLFIDHYCEAVEAHLGELRRAIR